MLRAVPEEVVALLLAVLVAVDAAEPDADALPDPFVEFEEPDEVPVEPEPLADFVAVAVELPAASVFFAAFVLEVDWVVVSWTVMGGDGRRGDLRILTERRRRRRGGRR